MNSLELPSTETLGPWLAKLQGNAGSCVAIIIEKSSPIAPPVARWCWLSQPEREVVRKSLEKINRQRKARGQATTEQKPAQANVAQAQGNADTFPTVPSVASQCQDKASERPSQKA